MPKILSCIKNRKNRGLQQWENLDLGTRYTKTTCLSKYHLSRSIKLNVRMQCRSNFKYHTGPMMTSLWLSEDSGPHAYIPKPEKFLQKQTIRTFNNGLKSEKREANTSTNSAPTSWPKAQTLCKMYDLSVKALIVFNLLFGKWTESASHFGASNTVFEAC